MSEPWNGRDVARSILTRIGSNSEIEIPMDKAFRSKRQAVGAAGANLEDSNESVESFDDDDFDHDHVYEDIERNVPHQQQRDNDQRNLFRRTASKNTVTSSGAFGRSSAALLEAEATTIAERESKAVSYLRLVVLAVLVSSAACTAIAVYFYTRNFEFESFRASFADDSKNIIEAVSEALYLWLGAADAYVVSAVSLARSSNQSWPFVAVPDAAVRLSKLRSVTKAVVVHQNHFVTAAQKDEWEKFSVANDQWASDALEMQKSDKNYAGQQFDKINPSPFIHSFDGNVTGDGPFLPTWHSSPVVSVDTTYNWDSMQFTVLADKIPEVLASKHVVISRIANKANLSDNTSIMESLASTEYIKAFIPETQDPSEPLSVIIFPMLDTAADSMSLYNETTGEVGGNSSVVGVFTLFFFFRDLLTEILPVGTDGIVCVVDNPCGEPFTYIVNGGEAVYAPNYVRDAQFDYLNKTVEFKNLVHNSSIGKQYTGLPLGGETCPYTLTVYPSGERESAFTTQSPLNFTLAAIFIFCFTSGVFLIYDICVERRQRKVLFTAVQSTANVSLLERMVNERTRRLEETNMRLEDANRRVTRASAAQLEHFACMSHEIRTPLNCIIGLSSLLLDTELGAMQEESMRMIVTSGDLLLTVVNDVLDYSKLESGNVEINTTRSSLQDTLNVVVQSIETKAQPKKLSIRTVYDPSLAEFLHMDHRRLQQILYNLLGNAIKFSYAGGTIDLSVSLIEGHTPASASLDHTDGASNQVDELYRSKTMVIYEDTTGSGGDSNKESNGKSSSFKVASLLQPGMSTPTKMIRFVVKDRGKGIERKDFETIFQPFRQASAETERVYGGTGLGLAVTSKLVTTMGGHISVDSKEGEWSEFTVDLPYTDAAVNMQQLTSRLKTTRVLLVDDNIANVEDMSRVFRQCGLDFFCFKSMDMLANSIGKSVVLSPELSYICLVHERIYEAGAFQELSKTARAVLLTHGHKYSVKEATGHYRSLPNVLPSVLIESFANFIDSMLTAQRQSATAATEVVRRTSVKFKNENPADNARILIAEDNKINQKVLIRILKRLHFDNVDIVDDGQQACDQELKKQYDVILMDIQMPIMNGIEACKEILNRESNHPKPKIVFVTAHVSDAFEEECRAAGGIDFLPKPFNISDIENCLRRHTQPLAFGSQDLSNNSS